MADDIVLPRWKCHKVVEAAKIISVRPDAPNPVATLDLSDGQIEMTLPPTIFSRGEPSPGDYIVRYKDGYVSWSPAAEFEDGYAPVD